MKRSLNIILANIPLNPSANGNRGCQALGYTTLIILDRILRSEKIEATYYALDTGFDNFKYFVLENTDIKVFPIPYPDNISQTKNLLKRRINLKEAIKLWSILRKIDYILDIGQGDSFADIYGKRRFMNIDKIHRLAISNKIPYCILPQTIGPFTDKEIKTIADESIAKSALCMVRDRQSYSYVVNNVPSQTTIKEYIDVAFFMPYNRRVFRNDCINVGLNVSALLMNGGYTQNNQFGLKANYEILIKEIINYFIELPNVCIHLVGHVISTFDSVENDYKTLYSIYDSYSKNERIILSPLFLSPTQAKSYISGLDFFMGARMHATIGAFSAGVPVVPMAYSRKFNGLFEDTLDYHYMTDLRVQTKEEVLSTIKEAFDKRAELKEIINNRMNTIVKERERLMYDDLRKFFKIAPNDK